MLDFQVNAYVNLIIGLSVHFKSGRGDELSLPVKQYIQNLLKVFRADAHIFIFCFARPT